jgi:chemotaxis protein MotB
MNLKGTLGNVKDSDINIKVDKGVVYIDISDKLLFKRGKYDVSDESKEVLAKVAEVLRQHPDMEFMVEGNTDDVPYSSGILIDNWDLSVKLTLDNKIIGCYLFSAGQRSIIKN